MLLQLDSCKPGATGYQRGLDQVTNFLISLEKVSLQLPEKEYIYTLKVLVDGNKEYLLNSSAALLNNKGICPKIPTAVYVEDIKKFNREFQKALVSTTKDMNISEYIVKHPGFNKVEENVVFCFSNGAITKEGFNKRIYTDAKGYHFSGEIVNNEEFRSRLFLFIDILLPCMESIYPVFLMNLMSVLSEPLRQWGIKSDLTLWIDGNSGSGKTSLATAVGTFTNRDSYGEKRVVSSTERVGCVVTALAESCGIPIIFDDVKYEKTQRQREKSAVSSDIVLRSVYQGRVTEQLSKRAIHTGDVYTCAIVTGEYMKTEESQNARLLYLNISEFIQEEKNRNALSRIQEHPKLIGTIMGKFIEWWIVQEEESQFQEKWQHTYQQIREKKWQYDTLRNGQRLKCNRDGLIFVTKLFERFVYDMIKDPACNCRYFFNNAQESINIATKNTFGLLQGMDAVVRQAMKEVLDDAVKKHEVRTAKYRAGWFKIYHQEEFCLLHNLNTDWKDTFVWIKETKKSLQKEETDIIIADDFPSLIIEKNKLMDLLFRKLERYIKEGKISRDEADGITLPYLARMQLIHSSRRSEGGVRGEKKYPLLTVRCIEEKYWDDDGEYYDMRYAYKYELEEVCVVQCNLDDSIYEGMIEACIHNVSSGLEYDNSIDEEMRQKVIRSRTTALSKRHLCPKNRGGR